MLIADVNSSVPISDSNPTGVRWANLVNQVTSRSGTASRQPASCEIFEPTGEMSNDHKTCRSAGRLVAGIGETEAPSSSSISLVQSTVG